VDENYSYNPRGAGAWDDKSVRESISSTAKGIACELNETLRACRAAALADVLPLVVRFVLVDAETRGREGVLTFDDLILRVRDLLRTNREAVAAFRARYYVLLIDEFQDTDPLQVEIALAFATDPETGGLEPGRLFLVGDPKQSIYRFRRADMAIYSHTRELVEGQGGEFPSLALNRRSKAKVLEWVNGVFEGMIGPGLDQSVQPPYRPIHASRDGMVVRPGVAWMGGEVADKNARQVREIEARAIAANCLAVMEEEWEVVERDGTARPPRLKDIAVLIPARTILPALERALVEAGVPYRVESGSLIHRTQEVRDLLNCLTAIDDPADEVAVVAALRCAAYACSDIELARHKAGGGSWNYLSPRLDDTQGKVADSLRDLRGYHTERHNGSLAALIERFVSDRGQVEVGMLDSGSRNSFRRARFVVDQARAFEASGPESLRAFVSWMERRAGEAILDNEGAGLDDDEDAVRVMTIHGAKGLEFPIVFVAGLGAAPMNRTGVFLVDRASDDLAVCIGAKSQNRQFKLGPVGALSELEGQHTAAEYARLLYVATTRARDHLVVSLYHKKGASSNCGAKRLIEHAADQLAERRPDLPPVERVVPSPFEDLEVDPSEELTGDAFEAGRIRLVKAATKRQYTSATAIGYRKKEEKADESEPWSRGRGGTRLGRAVHAAIQSLPLDADSAMIAAFSRAQAVAEAIPHRQREVERLVDWVLRSSQSVGRARSAERALREVPFALSLDGTVLEGFIDLVIESGDGIEIIDWKTDDLGADEVDARLDEYRVQAGLYVYGLEAALGRPVTGVTYVFAKPKVERSLGEPGELRSLGEAELVAQRYGAAAARTPESSSE
jgi:ATP-dependent helicase/nuclease subunit A